MTELARRRRTDLPWVVPSWTDPVVRIATGVIGGPLGRYAVVGARGLAGVAAAITFLGSVVLALGVWQKGYCLSNGWSTPDQFWRACYSDLPVVHMSSPLAERMLPWAGEASASDAAPLPGVVMWLIALVSPSTGQSVAAQQWVMLLWVLVCVALLAAAVLALVALTPRRPWQAAHLALSPALFLLALVSTDLLGVALLLLALWAWQRERSWVAGLLLGLALLVRPFPLLVLAAMVIVSARRGRALPALQVCVGTALGALVVLAPLVTVEPRALSAAEAWWSQPAGYGAVQMVPRLMGLTVPSQVTGTIAVLGWLLALAVGVWAARRHPTSDVVRLSALMLLVVVLGTSSLSVQSGLWVLPFLALSARAWWEHLVWALLEALHFLATWLYIAFASDPGRGLPGEAYAVVVLLRAAAWSWILWRVYALPEAAVPARHRPVDQPSVPTSAEALAASRS